MRWIRINKKVPIIWKHYSEVNTDREIDKDRYKVPVIWKHDPEVNTDRKFRKPDYVNHGVI